MAKPPRNPDPALAVPSGPQRWAGRLQVVSFFLLLLLLAVRPLLLETFTALLPPGAPVSGLGYGPEVTTALDAGVWLAAGLWALAAVLRPTRYRWTGVELPAAIMLAAAVISTLVASDKRMAITGSVNRLTAILFFVLLVQAAGPAWRRRLIISVVVASVAAFAGKCILQSAVEFDELVEQMSAEPGPNVPPAGGYYSLLQHRVLAREAHGYFGHSNTAGIYLVLGLFAVGGLAASKLLAPRAPMRRGFAVVAGLLAAPVLLGLAATKSRGAAAALAAGLVCWLLGGWLARRRRLGWALFWTVLVGLMALLWATSGPTSRIGSLLFRGFYWRTAVTMIRQHPLTGVGAENFVRHYVTLKGPRMVEEVRNPHNVMLTYLSEWGLLGGVGLLCAMLAVSWRLARPGDVPPALPLARGPPGILASGVLLLLGVLAVRLWAERHYPASFLLYENGVFGVIWLAAFVLACLDTNELGPINDQPIRGLSVPMLAGASAFLLHGLIDMGWFTPGVLQTFGALVAVVLVGREGPQPAAAASRRPRVAAVVAVAAALGLVGVLVECCWPTARTHAALREARAVRAAKGPARLIFAAYRHAVAVDRLDPIPPAEASAWLANVDVQQALFGSADGGQAMAWARLGLQRDPRDVLGRVQLARLLDRAGDLHGAVKQMQQAVELYPTYPNHRLELGELAYRLWQAEGSGEWLQESSEQFRQALALDAARVGEVHRRLTTEQVDWARGRLKQIAEAQSDRPDADRRR